MSLFIAENRLEEALVRAVKNPASLQDFYRLLMDSDLMVMGTVQAGPGATVTAGPGSQFQLETGEKNGARFLPVFTSLARMQVYAGKECKYLGMKARALFELTRGAPVILNPASEYGREFTPNEISALLNPDMPLAAPVREFGKAEYPQALMDALSALFQRRGDVATAWIIQHSPADLSAPLPLVGVETTADMRALMADIEQVAAQAAPGLVFDVQPVDRARPAAMADVLMQSDPFYIRAPLGRILN